MGDVEDIFVNPAGPRLSAADMGERGKKEIAEAKKRKKGSSTAAKSEQEVATQRKELDKKLAPHFIGEVGIPRGLNHLWLVLQIVIFMMSTCGQSKVLWNPRE